MRKKNGSIGRAEIRANAETNKLLLLWSGAAKRSAECATVRVGPQASEPTLTALGLAVKRRAVCAV